MKKLISILMVLVLLMTAGCSAEKKEDTSSAPGTEKSETAAENSDKTPKEQEASAETGETGEVSVYFIKGMGASALMTAVKDQLPENISLDIHEFADEISLKQEIDASGMPDLLLLEEGMYRDALDPYTLIADGQATPLSEYIESEKMAGTLKEEDYFKGVFTVGEVKDDIYYLPLSMKTYFGITSKAKYEDSPLASLDESYTLEELLDSLLLDKDQHDDGYMLTYPRMIASPDETVLFMEIMQETGVIRLDQASGETLVTNEEALEKIKAYCEVVQNDIIISRNIKNSDRFDTFYENYLMVTPNLNLAHQARYWQSAMTELLQEEEKLLFFPSCNADDTYGATANIVGMIGASSDAKNAAYRVLRRVMDIPETTWIGITIGDTPNILGPVSRKTFEAQLQALTDDYGAKYKLNAQTFTRLSLDEAQKESLSNWAEKVEIKPILSLPMVEFVAKLMKK